LMGFEPTTLIPTSLGTKKQFQFINYIILTAMYVTS